MHIKHYLLTAGLAVAMLPAIGNAQTVATFDDLSLPGTDTNFASTQPTGDYTFRSGNALFYGEVTSWGGYSGFNYSNMRDDTTQGYLNDKAAITAIGYDSSANYGVCFVPIDFSSGNSTATVPVGVKLKDSAAGHPVTGAYITNTTYAYWYMKDNFQTGDWFKLTVRGYLNGQQVEDSIDFILADTTGDIVKEWTWVDMTALGDVDSLTFDLSSSDTIGGAGMNNPAYFAIENLTTLDADTTDDGGTGIAVQPSLLALGISPNPVRNELNITTNQPVAVTVFDVSGRQVLSAKNARVVDVSSLNNGIYILEARNMQTQQRSSLKFVKQ